MIWNTALYTDNVSLVLYVATSSHGYECMGVLHGIEELCLVILVTCIPLLRPLHTYGDKGTERLQSIKKLHIL